MTTIQPTPSTPIYFVLTDSHGRYVSTKIITSAYPIIVKAISGLKWIDSNKNHLSGLSLLSDNHAYLSSSKAVMFLIGTNSVRCTAALTIIQQLKHFISTLRLNHSHLTQKHHINIVSCFPCFQPLYPFCTYNSLQDNIRLYNEQLLNLSIELNFTVIDFHVMSHHIGPDNMHINCNFRNLVQTSIIEYFEWLSSKLPLLSINKHCRSQEAKARRNHSRHIKMAQKQKQFYLSRRIEAPWTLLNVKNFLRQQHIKFAKIPPIYKHCLRIQFNNPADLESADETLPQHAFSQQAFSILLM